MLLSTYFTGMAMGLSLIVAIGAQNAFVLRQGLLGRHVLAVCLCCALSDAVLISAGVAGFGAAVTALPWLDPVMRYAGAGFLLLYGMKSLVSAWRGQGALTADAEAGDRGLRPVLLACLAITWLNPHVYLDTLVLLGAIASQYQGARIAFAAGAITGSFLFFFSLGYGAARLRPLFARPGAWRLLEAAIAAVMWLIAASLIRGH